MARWQSWIWTALLTLLCGLSLTGCRQYDVSQKPTLRDQVSDGTARLKTRPGMRSGMSDTAQDIERSVGY